MQVWYTVGDMPFAELNTGLVMMESVMSVIQDTYLLGTSLRKVGCTESLLRVLLVSQKRWSNVSSNPAGWVS